jgi:hypothetical protein
MLAIATNCMNFINGHSGRATGAQIMAAAGCSEWRIQVFGRWGSSAVLCYLREAQPATSTLLAREIRDAATLAEVKDDLLVKAQARLQPSQANVAPTRVQEAIERALEAEFDTPLGGDGTAATASTPEFWSRIDEAAARYLGEVTLDGLPKYLRNAAANSGVLHVPRDKVATKCGWVYYTAPRALPVYAAGADDVVCRRCLR